MDTNVPLKDLNSFGVPARAAYFTEIKTEDQLAEFLAERPPQLPWLILGGGSNLLFTRDFAGLVIKNALSGIEAVSKQDSRVLIRAVGGENWHDLVMYCCRLGLSGLENLAYIPGTVGAAPVQNIGAHGVELAGAFYSLEAVNITNGRQRTFTAADCEFSYRRSIFKDPAAAWLITAVTFALSREFKPVLSYRRLAEHFAGRPPAGPLELAEAVVAIRKERLPDPARVGNAGSFFKNPIVSEEQWRELSRRHPGLSGHPAAPGWVKLSAAELIEACGWRGKALGAAAVSEQHALVLINLGEATGAEILQLAQAVQTSVKERFGLSLETEVRII